jgi:hypothetical protein
MWTNSIVREVLKNKNVLGWFGINNVEIENYFPQIISDKVFQLVQNKLSFNVKCRGGSKYGMIRNLFKGLLFCSECGQQIETKIGTYKRVDGTVSHYADYISISALTPLVRAPTPVQQYHSVHSPAAPKPGEGRCPKLRAARINSNQETRLLSHAKNQTKCWPMQAKK